MPTNYAGQRRTSRSWTLTPTREKFSLAGAQAKIALHHDGRGWGNPSGRMPTTHILKPAVPGMEDQDLVQLVTMRLAQAVGLRVAESSVAVFAEERAFVTRRYDRVLTRVDGAEQWVRVHQEDMCQGFAVAPVRKYQIPGGPGPAQIAGLIKERGSSAEVDLRRFAEALAFNWLICGTDAHARNYSMLIAANQYRLAPLDDLNTHLAYSAVPAVDLSMRIGQHYREDRITGANWETLAAEVGVDYQWLRSRLLAMAESLPDESARSRRVQLWQP